MTESRAPLPTAYKDRTHLSSIPTVRIIPSSLLLNDRKINQNSFVLQSGPVSMKEDCYTPIVKKQCLISSVSVNFNKEVMK